MARATRGSSFLKVVATKKQTKRKKLSLEQLTLLVKKARTELEAKQSASPVEVMQQTGISSPLIIVSEEEVRLKRITSWLYEKVFSAHAGTALNTYFGPELSSKQSMDAILVSVRSQSLFSQLQVIVVHRADLVKAAVAKPLVEALSQTRAHCFVILSGKSINQRTPLLNNLADSGCLVELKKLSTAELKRFIVKETARLGVSAGIEAGAVELLSQVYGSDLELLTQELTKLSLLTDSKITKELVVNLITKKPEHTSFELLTQLSRKNTTASVSLVRQLVEQGLHPLQISGLLSRSFRTILAHKASAGEHRQVTGDLANPWMLRQIAPALKNFTERDTRFALNAVKELDLQLKGSKLPPKEVIVSAIQKIATR